ncbi:MAG: serine/threonine-protein kinase [Gemmataceae bacterium]
MTPPDPIPQPAASGRLPPPGPPTDATTGFSDGGDIDPPPGYVIEREVGRSAPGSTNCLARQVLTGRLVFLRLYHRPTLLQIARVRRVAEVLARVVHPGVEQVYGAGVLAGRLFIATEYLAGGSLADRLAAGPLPASETAEVLAAVAQGLHAAHTAGLVHRNVNPANVLFTPDGRAKVADFWLGQVLADDAPKPAGMIFGTPAYMAPEQARGDTRAVWPATDVWAVGVMLYQCLTGRVPWPSTAPIDLLRFLIEGRVPSSRIRNGQLDPVPEAICRKCLAKRPEDRYPTAAALADDLTRWRAGRPVAVAGGRVRRALACVRGR